MTHTRTLGPHGLDLTKHEREQMSEQTIVDQITDELMVNGIGQVATRLVLELPDGSDAGGLCRSAVEQILKAGLDRLERQNAELLKAVKAARRFLQGDYEVIGDCGSEPPELAAVKAYERVSRAVFAQLNAVIVSVEGGEE